MTRTFHSAVHNMADILSRGGVRDHILKALPHIEQAKSFLGKALLAQHHRASGRLQPLR